MFLQLSLPTKGRRHTCTQRASQDWVLIVIVDWGVDNLWKFVCELSQQQQQLHASIPPSPIDTFPDFSLVWSQAPSPIDCGSKWHDNDHNTNGFNLLPSAPPLLPFYHPNQRLMKREAVSLVSLVHHQWFVNRFWNEQFERVKERERTGREVCKATHGITFHYIVSSPLS